MSPWDREGGVGSRAIQKTKATIFTQNTDATLLGSTWQMDRGGKKEERIQDGHILVK